MKNVFLALTIVGAAFVNRVASGLTADILFSPAVFWFYLSSGNTPQRRVIVALNHCIGLSCALPLHLCRQAVLAEARPQPLSGT